MKPKPLTLEDIVLGRKYLKVEIHSNLSMHFSTIKILPGRHRAREGLMIRTARKLRGQPRSEDLDYNFQFASDLGLLVRSRYNFHRVFPCSERNRSLLKRLVKKQDIVGYMELIGIKNPVQVVQRELALDRQVRMAEDRFRFYE